MIEAFFNIEIMKAAWPIVLQGRSLMIRRYLEARHAWLFERGHPPVVTNSLQLVKLLVREGSCVAITSQFDAAPEIAAGTLVFIPVRDKAAEPQSLAIATSSRFPLPGAGMIVADYLKDAAIGLLAMAKTPPGTGSMQG